MHVKEFRIVLPLTVAEYEVAQLYSVAEASKNETGGGEGVEVIKNEPFKNYPLLGKKYNSGQYTHKIYHLASKAPAFLRLFTPNGSMELSEESWNAYPYCRTIITNPKFTKNYFKIVIESLHVGNDIGNIENVHHLSESMLKKREVTFINIATARVTSEDYKSDEDPTIFISVKTERGPFKDENWMNTTTPVMTCYKLVTCCFNWFGLQTRVENYLQTTEERLFTNFHRQLVCWMDRWHGLTINEIRQIEAKVEEKLNLQRKSGTVRGMFAIPD